MVHKDTEGGKFLIKIGVSPQKFSSQNLSANHFDTISTPTSCELIEAIAADSKNYDSAFDLVLDTFKTNKRTFNILCSQVENIWNCGAEAAYKIINDNNTR